MRHPPCNNRFSSLSEVGLSACFPLLPTDTQFPPRRQERKAANHRQLSLRSEAPAAGSSGWLGAVTKAFRETGGSRPLVALSLAVLLLGLMDPAGKAQIGMDLPSEFTGATGHLTVENSLVGGSIHLVLSQCRWTF
jgi:hypothetical protein